ncbi:MAG: hypothetical protein HOA52_05280 [Flavobacteriales bacterium]|nr:hypothetical protein [Flavobacteriales bacterium]
MLGISTELPIYYSIFCILLGVGYAYFLYRNNKLLSKTLKVVLFAVRTIVVSALAFLLLNPLSTIIQTSEEKPIVILAQDVSFSTSDISDSLSFENLKLQLHDNFDVVTYSYSDKVNEYFTNKKLAYSTNISNLFNEIDLKYSNRNLAGIVLSSDGLYNEGLNPTYHKIAKNIPIYTVSVGDTIIKKDVKITNVLYNEISFLDNISPVEVQILADKCKGENIKVSLYLENKLLETKSLTINQNSEFIKTNFKVKNSRVALQNYKVKINTISDEKSETNNLYNFSVDVLDSKYKILILADKVHPDIAAVKSVLDKNKNYEILQKKSSEILDSELNKYNLVISFYLENENSDMIKELTENSVSVLMFVNPLSVNVHNQIYPSSFVNSKGKNQEVTATYNSSFSKFNVSTDLQNYITGLPPLYSVFANYNISPSSQVLFYQKIGMHETKKPLIVLDETTNKKISVVYAEGLWKWRINDRTENNFHKNFDELFTKIAQYLLVKEEKSRFRITHDKNIIEGQVLKVFAEYYNESYELNNEKEVTIKIQNKDNEQFNYVFSKDVNSSYFMKVSSLKPSEYTYTASYNNSEEIVKGSFNVISKQKESKVDVANHQLLYQLSFESSGKQYFDYSNIATDLVESNQNKTIIHSLEKNESVINKMWLLILLLSFLSFEWIVRKYNGFY